MIQEYFTYTGGGPRPYVIPSGVPCAIPDEERRWKMNRVPEFQEEEE